MKRKRSRSARSRFPWLALVVAVYLVIATAYALALPWADMPDESAHSLYIEHLLEKRSLPVFTSGTGNYEAHQPPLYYLAAAPLVALARLAGGAVAAQGKAARLLSVVAGAAVVLLTYRIFRRVAPQRPELAELAAGGAAFLPSQLLVFSAVGNDAVTEMFFCALALAAVAIAAREPRWRELLALGIGVGLAVLTKVSACLLLVAVPVGVVLASGYWPGEKRARKAGWACALVLGAALLCSAWWFLRNQRLYGDPLGASRFVEIFSRDRPGPEYFRRYGPFVHAELLALWTFKSSLGVFGQANRFLPGWAYAGWLAVCLVSFVGCARAGWRSLRKKQAEPSALVAGGVLGAQMLLVTAAFLRFNAVFFQAQARYLGPAVAGWAGLWALGLLAWVPRERALLFARAATLLLAIAALLALLHGGERVQAPPLAVALATGGWGA